MYIFPFRTGPGAPFGSGSQWGSGGQKDLVQPNAQLHQDGHRHPGQRDHLTQRPAMRRVLTRPRLELGVTRPATFRPLLPQKRNAHGHNVNINR